MAHYNIFRQELGIKYPAYGHPLWEPSPGNLYRAVEIGDVGFIREGKFHRLFNALLPEDHESHQNFGVPEHHQPLQVSLSEHIDMGALSPNNFCSANVMVSAGGGIFASGPDSAPVSFSCRGAGAILSLPVPARCQDTLARGDFGKWIIKHICIWFAFTQRLGLGITRMEDIILVTGCHRARSSANVAFTEGRGEEQALFEARVSGDSNVEWRFPLGDNRGVALNVGPSGQNLPEDQCIFIRGFRATRLLGILPRLRGAAEPSQSPDEDEPEFDMQLLSIPDDIDTPDPLHTLLEYISLEAPECDMALVHDDDLKYLEDSSLETLRPDGLIDHLRKSAPRIWQVQFSGSEPETPVIKVATLTQNYFVAPQGKKEWTTLHTASEAGHLDVIRVLLDRGADVTAQNDYGLTPLHMASKAGHVEVIRVLLEWGADVTAQSVFGSTPLHQASEAGHVEGVRILLDRGVKVTSRDEYGSTPLHTASEAGHEEVIRLLLDNGADVTAQDDYESTPLHVASGEGHVDIVRVLLERGADVSAQNKNGSTPLHVASGEGHVDVIRVLLEQGAIVTAQNENGSTPLHIASGEGRVCVVRVLLENGADVSPQNKNGSTPLHTASQAGDVELIRVLLDYGADVTAQDEYQSTPLHAASEEGHVDVIRVLLERGADVLLRNKDRWWTPLHSAKGGGPWYRSSLLSPP